MVNRNTFTSNMLEISRWVLQDRIYLGTTDAGSLLGHDIPEEEEEEEEEGKKEEEEEEE